MKLIILRNRQDDLATQGELYVDEVNGDRFCYTMEPGPHDPNSPKGPIPCGTYEVVNSFSPHFSSDMPHLVSVPGFQYVMIHPGNFVPETHGCILVGLTEGKDFLGSSDIVFRDLYTKMKDAWTQGKVYCEIRQEEPV